MWSSKVVLPLNLLSFVKAGISVMDGLKPFSSSFLLEFVLKRERL